MVHFAFDSISSDSPERNIARAVLCPEVVSDNGTSTSLWLTITAGYLLLTLSCEKWIPASCLLLLGGLVDSLVVGSVLLASVSPLSYWLSVYLIPSIHSVNIGTSIYPVTSTTLSLIPTVLSLYPPSFHSHLFLEILKHFEHCQIY
ncbi:uncharacterized protein AB9W97_013137 isoform 1-T1 [Spinachia spinachia]